MHRIIQFILKNQFLTAVLFIAGIWLIIELQTAIITLFLSFIIMASLVPTVEYLKKYKFPKALAVAIPFFTTLLFLILLIFPLVPFFLAQMQMLFLELPDYIHQAGESFGVNVELSHVTNFLANELGSIGQNAFTFTTRVFGGLFTVLSILVISFYFLLDHERIRRWIVSFFPPSAHLKASKTVSLVEDKLGAWMRGQILLSFFIGGFTWVALTLLGLPFALPLALIAGMLEMVPTIGPIISSIPAILIAIGISPTVTVLVILLYIVIQALENNILVPKIMEKAVGLNPIVIIIAVMVGAKLMGVVGALLAIPFVTVVTILYKSLEIVEEEEKH